MKKAKMIGKKTLSVFLAVLMVLTAWVWVAPTEAEAINSGEYSYKVYMDIADDADISSSNWKLYGKGINGSSTESEIDSADNVLNGATGEKTIMEGTSDKFPSKFTLYLYMSIGVGERIFEGTAYLQINKNGTMTNIPLTVTYTEHNGYGTHSVSGQKIHSDTDGTNWVGGDGKAEATFTFTVGTDSYPVPTKIVWDASPSAVTIPGSTYGRTHCQDQYGVTIGVNPTNSFTSSPTTGLSGSTSNGTSYSQYTITASDSAKMSEQGVNSRDVKMTASYTLNGTTISDSKTFKINDPKYTVTINANGAGAGLTTTSAIERQYGDKYNVTPGATRTGFTLLGFYYNDHADSYETLIPNSTQLTSDTVVTENHTWYAAWQANQYKMKFTYRDENGNWVTTDEVTEYFGRDIPFPEVTSPVEEGVDHTYTFTGWSPVHTTVQAVDGVTEYTATYNDEPHYAVLTALNEQIILSNEKKDEALYKEGAYTETTVDIFEDTLELAEMLVSRKPLLSEQSSVDALVKTLEAARKNLDIKNYTVIFTDDDGTILKDGYFFVTHGTTVEVPSHPEKNFDETNHYEFDCWDYEESNRLEECNYVTDNLIYVAYFVAEAHSFTETVTPSTCTEDGVVEKTCACGYSYTIAGDKAGHTWSTDYKEIIPATCATKGAEAKYCTVCGAIDESTKRDVAELGHKFGAYTEYTPATCFGKGAEISECSRCGGKDVKEIAKKTHAYGKAEKIEKTCTTDGYTKEVCTLCGFTNIRDIDKATGHSISETTVHSTCVSSGYIKEYCASCDYEKTTILPATGNHTYPETWTKVSDATCVGHGVEKRVCTVCNAATETRLTSLAEHTKPSDWTTEVEAWCDSNGRKVKNCTVCGKELESETITKLGHAYEVYAEGTYAATCETAGANAEKCSRCGDINTTVIQPLGHDWNEGVTTAATCTTDGTKTFTCSVCNETKTETIKALGHNWSEWTVVPSTNGSVGSVSRTCKRETCKKVESVEIPAGGHELVVDTENSTPASCKAEGKTIYICKNHSDCGITITVDTPKTQHTIVTYEEVATCTKDGYIKTYCSVDGCTYVASNKVTKKIAHVFEAQTAVAPTCTTSGYTPYKCSCGDSYNEYDESKPATGHDFDETIATNVTTKDATCTVDGSKKVKCKNCDVKNEVVIPATGHNYTQQGNATDATCTTPSTALYKCENCNDTYTKFISGTTDHSWGNWTVVSNATANERGVEIRTCACGAVEYKTTAPTGEHVFEKESETPATCSATGSIEWKCKIHANCEANYTETLDKLAHTQKVEYIAPTCNTNGSTQIICSVCNAEITAKETISATGIHDFSGEGVKSDAKCTTDGSITYNCKTNGCNATKVETIPAKGHNYVSTVTVATCEKAGEVVTTCSSCGDTTTKILAALNHKWNEGVENPKATCTSTGTKTYTCTVAGCGKTKTETIKALGHNWGDWKVTPSTNNATGSVSRKCLADNCDGTETITIPAGGHNLVVDEVNSSDATCTGEGTLVYKCENHIDCGITVSVTVPMIQHKLETKTEKEVSCTEDGKVVTKCTSCKNAIVETIIPAKGHIVTVTTTPATCIKEGSVVEDCDNCDYKATTPLLMIPHDYRGEEINKVDANCTADGSKTIQCKTEGCTATTTVIIPHTGHTWNAWTITKPATNTADGEMTRTCSNGTCTETVVIPKGGHIWDNGTVTKDATCTETGTMVYKCNNADHGNCTASYEVAISIKEHTIAQREIESTCKVEGSVEAYCSKCNRVLSTETIPVKAHEYTAGTPVDATCTTSGYTPYKCSCGDTYNVYDATKPANGHSLVEGTSTATCTEGGVMTLKCENCTYSTTVNVPALGHNYVKVSNVDATCAVAATETYTCEHANCNSTYTISVGEKSTTHTWGDWTVKESADQNSIGYQTRTCKVCGQLEVAKIDATGEHKFIDGDVVEGAASKVATCTEDGYETRRCSVHDNCPETAIVAIPATGHTEEIIAAVDATCTTPGSTTGIKCSTCNTVLEKVVELPALGHDWNSGKVTNATCKEEGKIEYTCTRTGCNATHTATIPTNANAHQYETKVVKATCISVGSVVTKCKLCGNITTNETLAQLQHTWDSGSETKAATCLVKGETTYECTVENCDATKTEDIPALGHSWSEWIETKASTNSDKGEMKRSCERDGCTASETVEIPAGGHNFENAPVINKDASCTAVGSATYKCSAHENCGVEVDVVLPMLQHELEKSEQAASCDTDGFVTVKCKNCDTATYTTVIPKTGCAWNEGEITKAATCTEEGTMTFTCAYNADHKYTKQIAKTQHNYKAGIPVAATCTSNGYTPYKCETCDSSYVILDADAPAKGHTFNTVVSSTANCTDGGVMTLKCACGKTMETQVPALGHDYQFSVATMATCAEAATETFKCSRCADSYTVSVGSKTNIHDWNAWVTVDATNTSLGYKTRTCKACDKLEFEIIPATGEHKFDTETNDKKAETCTEGGYIVYACSTHDDCGLTSKVTIPAKGHTEQLSYKAASCSEAGYTKITCAVVGCDYEANEVVIPALEHVWGKEEITQPTCSAIGSIKFICTSCNKATKTVEIPVNEDAHQFKTNVDLATCKEAGSVTVICENGCTYTEETAIPKLQHSWGEWSVTTPSTNSTDGEMTRYCGSGCSETVKIPAGGHAFKDTPDSTTPASCTAEGTATYNCTAHTNCGVTITVKTEKLQHTLVTDSKDSSCTESGYVKVYCSECKKEYSNMTFGKLAHDYKVVVEKVDATCTTAGHTILKCVNCDAKYDRFDAQPNGHEYKDEKAIVETKPTCTKMGYTTYTCDICRSSYTTNFVNPTGHKYTSVVTAPTCTASGYTTYTCTCGESYVSNPVSPTGHNFDEKIEGNVTIVSADCEADGLKTVKCNNCDATNVTVLPATGHDYDVNNDGKINLDDAEMIDGEFVYVCQNAGCSHKIKAEDDEDDTDSFTVRFFDGNGKQVGEDRIVLAGEKATAPETATKTADNNYHYTFSGWDRDFSKIDKDLDVYATFEREAHYGGEATCFAQAVCDKCGVGYGEFDATKHIIVTKSKSATCEADGWIEYYCSVEICGYHYSTGNYLKKETIGASGHVYGKWTIVQNGTCEIPQIQQRRCVNVGCNKIDEKRTQSTHTWMIEPKINPTCSSVGYTEFKYCLTCNLQIDRVEIPKTDHKDLDGNGYCDYCGTSKGTPKCNCMCHSTGIMKLFYGIVKFFWKLTKSSRSCSCGAVHY